MQTSAWACQLTTCLHPAASSRGIGSFCRLKGGDRWQVKLPVVSRPLIQGERLLPGDGRLYVLVLRVVVVGVHGPSSGLISRSGGSDTALPPSSCPARRSVSVQGEADVGPGTFGASLIPPSGGTMPLLRGEAVPGGVAPTQGAYQEWPWLLLLI